MKMAIESKPYAVLSVVWMGIIYLLSSRPASDYPALFFGADKLVHFVIFGILGVLIAGAIGRADGATLWPRILAVTGIVMVYGFLDEWHQAFVPGRSPDVADVMADTAGGFVATTLAYRFRVPLTWARLH